jgi:microcystin-dependent protein
MTDPYVGEIRMVGFNFAPAGWAYCDGALLPISENDTLFNLIGTTYGGDGQETFALPNLQSRVPIHMGQGPGLSNYVFSEMGGVEDVTLTTAQIPAHSHSPLASASPGTTSNPGGAYWAGAASGALYATGSASEQMSAQPAIAGGSQPHSNLQPYLTINFVISLFGVYPQPN